jgi:SAM-dependent methyltransferase
LREAIVNYVKWAIEQFPYEEPILDTCAGWEPNYYQPLFPGKRYIKQDMQDFDPPCIDMVCDVTDMNPIPDESIGLVLNCESLEHIQHPQKAIDEIHRVLRPNGLLILTTVMHFKIHRTPKDYWRFAPDGIELLLNRFKILDCALEGNLKRPKGIWVTAQNRSLLRNGKAPPRGSSGVMMNSSPVERRIGRLKGPVEDIFCIESLNQEYFAGRG